MEKLIEIARSFSWTVQVENFAPRNFFCSEKMECLESEAEETSKKLFHFCRRMVEKDVEEYLEAHKPEHEKVVDVKSKDFFKSKINLNYEEQAKQDKVLQENGMD